MAVLHRFYCTSERESTVFKFFRFSLFLKDPFLPDYLGLDARKPDFVIYEQQTCRSACAFTKSDLGFYYFLTECSIVKLASCYIQNFNILF